MGTKRFWTPTLLAATLAVASCGGSDTQGPVVSRCPVARIAAGPADLVPGPLARGTAGDLVIENDRMRAIVQKGGRNWYNISQFGGNIIDALPKAADGSLLGQDHFEEFVLGTNIESAPNFQTVVVADAGGENADGSCRPAVIRATGPDDLLDFVNGSSAIRGLSLQGIPLNFPPSSDDVDLPLGIQTQYTLEDGKPYIRIDTTLTNESSPPAEQRIYLVEYLNGSGEVEVFQHGYGFGEAFATAPCDGNRCSYVAYAGHEGGTGVSYGVIHREAGTTSVSVSGVTVLLYGRDIVTVALTAEGSQAGNPATAPNYTVPAGGSLTFTRWFAVGGGTVASIVDARNEIHGLATGTVHGVVTEEGSGAPVAGAEIAMTSSTRDGFTPQHGPVFNVVNHFRTDAEGRFRGTYPAGTYTLEVNVPGRLAATPATRSVTIVNGQTTPAQLFTVPRPSFLRVNVRDPSGAPIAAKVQLVGARLGPDGNEPRNSDCLGFSVGSCSVGQNPLGITTGFFGDNGADPLPPGIALAEFAVLDPGSGAVTLGDTGAMPIEPGTYELAVSHGPRYAAVRQPVTVAAAQATTVNVTLAEVMPTPGHVYADFHVHSFDSPDSEVTNRERVATYLAEDMDFFTPSDHDTRIDFAPVVSDMGVAARIATAPSAEVTTFDYGHFNFWPMRIETDRPCDDFVLMFGGSCEGSGHSAGAKISKGATDWGGQAPLGQDFPSRGHFSLSPQQIFDSAEVDPHTAGRVVVKQINHIDGHFGNVSGSGLGIDTGIDPPQSTVPSASRRLAGSNQFSDDFDTLELLIGTDGLDYQDNLLYNENMGVWFNLLNQGRSHTGISNSDTHQRRVNSMHTRNQIAVPAALLSAGRANIGAIAADPHTVGDAVRAGYSTMTTGPFLQVTASKGGNVATLSPTRAYGGRANPLPAADGAVALQVDVRAPLWAPYDQILVFVNGETVRHVDELGMATSPPRYAICGPQHLLTLSGAASATTFTRAEVRNDPANAASARFQTSASIALSHPGGDYWFVVMARGTKGVSPTMFPFVPNSHVAAADDADADGIRALAISNPIYVDVDGGGWTPPGVANTVHTGALLPPDPCPVAMPAP